MNGLLVLSVTAIPADNPDVPITGSSNNPSDLRILVKNINSGAGISGARVYLDGGYEGMTSGNDGSLIISPVSGGSHSIRVIKRGYMENIKDIKFPAEQQVVVSLHPLKVIPVGDHGPVEERIDIVFVPSNTQYDCTKQQKILTDYYTSNEENFRNDVNKLIQNNFLTLDAKISKTVGLPENFQDRFNFYYYSDPGDFADAFNGCAGSLPEDFWEDAPFTDVAIIIYPKYEGTYQGPPCEPNGCANGMGPGVKTWFKIPADSGSLFIHEAGHAVFGLIDTYCGETYYTQNNPDPNVWSSLSGCILASENDRWESTTCRQIAQPAKKGSAESCQKDFWRYDPEPDIMATPSFWGKFGNASTLHIRYILENINRWKL
ncbi:MAG: PEGA domain-containing protein [Methanoregula sp.]